MALIEIVNMNKKFNDNYLFKNLSLEIEEGEFIGLIGCSGSGKTTLLNIIGLISKPTSGQVNIANKKSVKINSKDAMLLRRYKIGYLLQNYGLVEDENVKWNLMLSLEYSKLSRREKEEKIERYLESFKMKESLNKMIFELSGGEQERISIIKLFLKNSDIVIADEPTTGLDDKNINIVMDYLKELNRHGKTIIMVTHDSSLYKYFSRIINVDEINCKNN